MTSDHESGGEDPRLATLRELFDGVYAVHESLAWGGLAIAYRATEPGRELALAVPPIDCSTPEHAAQFQAVAAQMSALRHDGLLAPTDTGIEEGIPFIEYEYFPARTLRDAVEEAPLSVQEGAELAQQLTDALKAAHAAGLPHGDVTPSTVLLEDIDGARVPRLFGTGVAVAIYATRDTRLTGPTGRGSGPRAARFLAPELRLGQAPSPRADIYSVAAVVLYSVTGVEPEREPGPVGEPLAHRPAFAAVIERALAQDPAARFPDVGAMHEAVLHAMAASGIPSVPPRPPSRRPPALAQDAGPSAGGPATVAPSRARHVFAVLAVLAVIGGLLYVLRGPGGVADTEVAPPPPTVGSPAPAPAAVPASAPAPAAVPASAPVPAPAPAPDSAPDATAGAERVPVSPRGPLAGELPAELAAELARVEAGERFEQADFDRLFGYASRNRRDARVHLIMARAYMARDWRTAAAARYAMAYQIDPGVCEDDHLMPDLLRIATTEGGEEKIARPFRGCADASDLPTLDAAIEAARNPDARRRLRRLRERAEAVPAPPAAGSR